MYYINIVPKLTNFNMKLTKNHGIETRDIQNYLLFENI